MTTDPYALSRLPRLGRRVRVTRVLLALALLSTACPDKTTPDAGAAAKEPAAHLEVTKGDVRLDRDGEIAPAQLGYLYVNDAVETGAASEAKVRFGRGRVIEVGPDARFEVTELEGGLVLNIARGLVLAKAPTQQTAGAGESDLISILTPFGLTTLGDAEVSHDVKADSVGVDVKIGTIELMGKDGKVQKAGAGQLISMGAAQIPVGTMVLPTIEVMLNPAGGRALVKKKGSKDFQAVTGKKPVALKSGDALLVKSGAVQVVPQGSSSKLTFAANTEIVFDEATRGAGIEETSLEMKKGQMTAFLSPGQKNRLKLSGITLVSDLGGQVSLVKTADGFDVAALAGDLTVHREGKEPTVVEGGKAAKIGANDVKVEAVSEDAVSLPTRKGATVFHSGLGRVALRWQGEDNKPYRVEVAQDSAFKNTVLSGVVHQRFVNVAAPANGSLHWRVFDQDKEIDRGSASFRPELKVGELEGNRNEVLDGAEKTTIYYQDKPPSVTFLYKEAEGATNYKVLVYSKDDLTKPVAEQTSNETKLALPPGSLDEGEYAWSVTALDAQGAEVGGGGKMNKLELSYWNAVPNLIIKSPKSGDVVSDKAQVVGIAPVGAKVFVNGALAQLDEKARFNMRVAPLSGGRLIFRMLLGGSDVYTVRTVRVKK